MSPRGEFSTEPCLNCGDSTPGRFCPACGQRKGDVRISLRRMLAEVLEDQLSINATLPRTVVALLFRPGHLTTEYLKGRIASYIPPFRLYLATSVFFFLALSLTSRVSSDRELVTAGIQPSRPAPVADSAATGPSANDGSLFGVSIRTDQTSDSVPWTENVTVNTGIPALDSIVVSRIRELGRLPGNEAASRLTSALLDRIPTAMFVLLPVFAALLALLYVFRRRFYVEHFVFALHYHAFAFLAFLILMIGWGPLRVVLGLWMGIYLWLAMRKVYGQGWLMTTGKWAVLNLAYLLVLTVAMVVTAVVAVLLL